MSDHNPDFKKSSRLKRILRVVALLLLLLVVSSVLLVGIRISTQPQIRVSPETTHFTEPVDGNGRVDYAEAINRHFEKDIRPEDNVAVALYEALGPKPGGTQLSDEFFVRLGMHEPPAEGEYFVELAVWLNDEEAISIDAERRSQVVMGFIDCMRLPWQPASHPEVAQWLKAMDGPLKQVRKAVQLPRYFSPLLSAVQPDGSKGTLISVRLPGTQAGRELSEALVARAMLRMSEGRHDEALQDLITTHRLARHLGNGSTLIEMLVGVAVEARAIAVEQVWIEAANPNDEQLRSFSGALDNLPPRAPIVDRIGVTARAMCLDIVRGVAEGTFSMREFAINQEYLDEAVDLEKRLAKLVDWNVAMKLGNEWYDRAAETMRIDDRTERLAKSAALHQEWRQSLVHSRQWENWALVLVPGSGESINRHAAHMVLGLLRPAVHYAGEAHERSDQRMRNLRIAIALQTWKNHHGMWPASLDDLQPEILKTVPVDLYSNKLPVYRRTDDGFVLYSVGENGEEDLTVRIPHDPSEGKQ